MRIYEDSDNSICNAKSNLNHVVHHASKPSEAFISNEALGGHTDDKAYVRTMESEYEGNKRKSSAVSIVDVSTNDADILKEHEVPHIEHIHLNADVTQILMHDRGLDPKMQLTSKAVNNARPKYTVPQPFTFATDKRASDSCRFTAATVSNNDKKHTNMNNTESPNLVKKNQASLHIESRKRHQPENTVEEEVCSLISLCTASVKAFKSRSTVASAPTFRVSQRAEKWKEFYLKLEQKQHADEAKRIEHEARKKEEEEAALKELRRSMNFKASPMPRFYHEGPPPKTELKKKPATRAKSPKFSPRRSCGDLYNSSPADRNSKLHVRANCHIFGSPKDAKRSRSDTKNRTPLRKEENNQNETKQPTAEAIIQC